MLNSMQRGQKITLSNVFVFSTLVRDYVSSDYTLANLIENVELSAFQYQLTTYRWKLLFFWMFFIFLQSRDKGYGKVYIQANVTSVLPSKGN